MDKELQRIRQNISCKKYQAKHKEEIREYHKKWRQAHPDYYKQRRARISPTKYPKKSEAAKLKKRDANGCFCK